MKQQGLLKYSNDPEFVRYTSTEMQEALEMTREEMDRAAHRLLLEEQTSAAPIKLPNFKNEELDLDLDEDTDTEESNLDQP